MSAFAVVAVLVAVGFVFAILSAVLGARAEVERNFILGLFLGPLGLLVAVILKSSDAADRAP